MKNEKPKHTPGPRCTACKWVHEANSETGESFMGVELCPLHASAPELLAALEEVLDDCQDDYLPREMVGRARAAIAKAKGG